MMKTLIQKICMKLAVIAIFAVCTNKAEFNLVVPSAPVIGSVGHDIILPCHLSPVASAVPMRIRWFREGDFLNYLYHYRPSKSSEGKQYEGRVSLFTQELQRGNMSLLLKDLTISDRGRYKCQASHLEWIQEEAIDLQITQQGTVPRISLVKFQRRSLKLSCRSHSWSEEPRLVWMDRSRKEIVSEKHETIQDGILFSVTSHLTLVNHQPEGVFCVVFSQDKKFKLETGIQMTGEFYTDSEFNRMYLSAFLIPLFFGLVSVTVSMFYAWHERKRALHERKMATEELKPLTKMKEQLEEEKKKTEQEADKLRQMENSGKIPVKVWDTQIHTYAEDVLLDSDTAHPRLQVSEDGKSVAICEVPITKNEGQKHFLGRFCVLGKTGYDTGRHYWEIDLGEKTQWSVGVAQFPEEWVDVQTYPNEGYWCISLEKGMQTCERSPTNLSIKLKPKKLGVFLDCEGKTVTFFNVEKRCWIHFFHCDFNGKLFPFIGPLKHCKKKLCISEIGCIAN